MKISCFIFLAVLGASLATPSQSTREPQNVYSILDQYIFDSEVAKFLDTCSLTGNDVMRAIEEVIEKSQDIDMERTHICDFMADRFMDVMEPLTDLFDTSCNKNTKIGNIGKASVLTLQSVAAYICETDGKHLMELIHPCWRSDNANEESDSQCIERVQRGYESRMEDYMTNSNLVNYICESVQDVLDQCIKSKLDARCKMDMTREAFTGFMDALMDPCNEEARLVK